MNEIQKQDTEIDHLIEAAMRDVGSQKMLKFVKGDYICDGQEVERGTQMIAQCLGFTKIWVKFWDGKRVERKIYRVIKGEVPPEPDEMPDRMQSHWQIGLNGQPSDPWTLQYLLPMENPETNETLIFVTSSAGGKSAIGELIGKYASRRKREHIGQPLIRLQKSMMPTAKFGNVVRPLFEIVSFETIGSGEPIREIAPDVLSQADNEMNDQIPF